MFVLNHNTSKPPVAIPNFQNDSEQPFGYQEFRQILETVNAEALLTRLKEYRFTGRQYAGRKQYAVETMWSAFLLLYYLNLASINELIRRLQDSQELQAICGFRDGLPHRTTFNRFFVRMGRHLDLLEVASAEVLEQLQVHLEDFGEEISIDSTTVPTNANPHRKHGPDKDRLSDIDAGWTKKNSARAKKDGKDWHYGYKFHAAADANWNIPICGITTPANRNDTTFLKPLVAKASEFAQPEVLIADRGYDSKANHEWLIDRQIAPIINIRKSGAKGGLYDKQFNFAGAPVCECGQTTEFVDSVQGFGDYYICANQDEHFDHAEGWWPIDRNVRLRGPIRRDTEEWDELYDKRQSIERVFKSMKQSLRLESHYHRGLQKISLHCLLSMLVFQATALVKALLGDFDELCWMTRRIA